MNFDLHITFNEIEIQIELVQQKIYNALFFFLTYNVISTRDMFTYG